MKHYPPSLSSHTWHQAQQSPPRYHTKLQHPVKINGNTTRTPGTLRRPKLRLGLSADIFFMISTMFFPPVKVR
ncbi:MAG: hypothetical protein LQ352_004546 [Teloschistes flavicans]|nr:MAG: hypothetical protein LQ352_004546 [Teloschistes flavicans]